MIIYSHGGLDCNKYEAEKINRLVVLRLLHCTKEAERLAKEQVFRRLEKRGVISFEDER